MAQEPARHDAPAHTVFWTKKEKSLVQFATIKILEADPTLTRQPAVMQAQAQVLPVERQRPIAEWGAVRDWLILPPHLAAQFGKYGNRIAAPTTAEPAKRQQPPQLAASSHRRNDGKTKVFWNADEQAILARSVAIALHEDVTKSRLDALRLAQQDLPEDRRRNLNSATPRSLPWFDAAVDKALKAARAAQAKLDQAAAREQAARDEEAAREQAAREKQEAEDAAAKRAPAVSLEATAAVPAVPSVPSVAAAPFSVPSVPSVLAPIAASSALASLRGTLVDALAGIFREALVQAIQGMVPAAGTLDRKDEAPLSLAAIDVRPAHDPRQLNGASRAPRRSVLVAGLKGTNKELIKAEFGHLLDLRFYCVDESKHHLKALASAADVTVAVIDFLGHSHTDTMKAHSSHYVQSTGGMSTLRETLQTLVLASQHTPQTTNGTHHALSTEH